MTTFRYLFSALLLLAFSGLATAQIDAGFRLAYGSTNIRTDSDFDAVSDQFESASARTLGFFLEIPFGEVFSLRPGLEIARRGTSLKLTADQEVFGVTLPVGVSAKTRFTYVDLPVLFQFQLPTERAFKPYAFFGPNVGYATGGNIRTTAKAIIEFNLMTTDINLDAIDYNRFHVAAVGGVGFKLQMSPTFAAFVEGRFEQSLNQPYDVPVAAAKTGFKGGSFGAGVAFAL